MRHFPISKEVARYVFIKRATAASPIFCAKCGREIDGRDGMVLSCDNLYHTVCAPPAEQDK
jgi:hypothetical protein